MSDSLSSNVVGRSTGDWEHMYELCYDFRRIQSFSRYMARTEEN